MNGYSNNSHWAWLFCGALFILVCANVIRWRHGRKARGQQNELHRQRDSVSVLNEKYAGGEMSHEDYLKAKESTSPGAPLTNSEKETLREESPVGLSSRRPST